MFFLSILDLPPLLSGSKAGALFRDWKFSQLAAFRSGFPYTVLEPFVFDPGNPVILYNGRADLINPTAAVPSPVSDRSLAASCYSMQTHLLYPRQAIRATLGATLSGDRDFITWIFRSAARSRCGGWARRGGLPSAPMRSTFSITLI